jgi:hypothetical protein
MDEDLIIRAAILARTAPESWKEFLGAFTQYTNKQRDNLVASPFETLPVAQGRAQACTRLLDLLVNCQSKADQYQGKRK